MTARLGTSTILLVRGEPGIGKTALLGDAADRAAVEGMAVLSARGVESEAEVPFGGLLELLRPALDALDRLPAPQAAALHGALGLGPRLEASRFLVGAATLGILEAHAERRPLLVLVDDAHWLDEASLAAIVFAARRLLADPIAVVLAVRSGETAWLERTGLPQMDLGGLDSHAASALLGRHGDEPIAAGLAEQLHRATRGNPLALVELARDGPRGGLALDPLGAPVPIGAGLERAFLGRVGVLSQGARAALVVVAADESGMLAAITPAARSLGIDPGAIEEAERAGLLRVADLRVEFSHPLVRSAVYQSAPPHERRAAHAAIAGALGAERDADRRAWHLAAAAFGPDEGVAAALEAAGSSARGRSAHSAAASALERAALLSPDDEARSRRLVAAADSARIAGEAERTARLIEEALERTADARLRAEAQHVRGLAAIRRGPVMAGHDILVAAAASVEALDPQWAATMYAEAANACFFAGRPKLMLEAARRAWEILPPDAGERESALGALALGMALILEGQGSDGTRLVRGAIAAIADSKSFEDDPWLLAWGALGVLFLREASTGRALVARAIECARSQGALGILPFTLFLVARDAATSDRWGVAEAQYDEAIQLARETGQDAQLCANLAGLACIETRRGRADGRAHAQEALELSGRLGLGAFRVWALGALADEQLGLADLDDAIGWLVERERALRELEIADVDLSPAPELVEAYVRAGRVREARRTAADYVVMAERKGQPWALARAERCRGLLADDLSFERHFALALAHHGATTDAFEEARTRLCFGERLRRARQRVRARGELRAAFAGFDGLGAAPWSERARVELLASGETARARDPSAVDQLTPQELRIAMLLGEGRTTREAASALFLSAKTIEHHLRNAYRKLGVHSRDALAEALRSTMDR